jgi:DNA polymerase elongation subunit (family B)
VLDEINQETKLPIELEDVYPWMAFVASRPNPRLSVANRFFGLQSDGEYKIRGLASRREDTPSFVEKAQLQVLQILAQEKDPRQLAKLLPEVLKVLYERISALRDQSVPAEELLITQTLSRDVKEYRVSSPVVRAARQLQAAGKKIQMGQRIQFIYVKTKQGVHAWEAPNSFHLDWIDRSKYRELLFRAAYEVLQPLGITENILRDWIFTRASYLLAPGFLHHRLEMPLFAHLSRIRPEII